MAHLDTQIPLKEKIGYGLGDCAANFVFQTQLIFLMSFYTDVVGLASATVGTMFLVSRLWDAVNDPIIGALADRTSSRWGRFRPWVLVTAVPFGLCFFLAYSAPDLDTRSKIVWAYVTYNLLMMVYSANNIPYAALTGVLTSDPDERTSLTSWRFLLAMTAGFLVQSYTLAMVDWFGAGDDASGYRWTIGVWAALGTTFLLVTFATTTERVQPSVSQRTSVAADVRALLRNRSWLALATMTLFYFVYLAMRGGMGVYYFEYVLGRPDLFGWFGGGGLLASMVGILVARPLATRIGKRDAMRLSLLLSAVATAAFYWLPPTAPELIIASQWGLQFIYGISIPLTWAMMADVADWSEVKSGVRATAMTFAATVFALKLGLSLGGAASGWLLDGYGYVPNAVQTETALEGLTLMMSVFPAIAFVIAAGALSFYEIDRQAELSLAQALDMQRAKGDSTPPEVAEQTE